MPVHVAPNGSDNNTGTSDQPLKSISKACATVRASTADERETIVLHGGSYYDTELVLTPADSGLTIEAAAGETPMLYGGHPVTDWEEEGGFFAARLDGVRDGTLDFRTLVVDDEVRPRARLPREGTYTHLTRFSEEWINSWYGDGPHEATHEENTTMRYDTADIGSWLDVNSAEITVFGTWDVSHVGIQSLDDDTQTATFSTECMYPPGCFGTLRHALTCRNYGTYVVYNVREGMHEPGQWYLDRTEGKLVYWPLPGEDISTVTALAPTQHSVVRLEEGTVNVTLQGLTVSCTSAPMEKSGWGASMFPGAIEATGIHNCRFTDVTVENVDGQGFKVGGKDIRIERCAVRHTGADGILLVDADHSVVARNRIHHVGCVHRSSPAINETGELNVVEHNEVHDVPYCGIGGGGTGSIYQKNLLYRTMNLLCDGGAIYIYGKGQMMRGNFVHTQRDEGWGVIAYYMDLGSENSISEHNLAVNTGWTSLDHISKDCTVRNNVYINAGTMRVNFGGAEGLVFENNILMADEILFYPESPDKPAMPGNIMFSFSGTIANEKEVRGEPRTLTPFQPRDGSIAADPGFVDRGKGDFSFQSESPAPALGIEPIDVADVGIDGLCDEFWANLHSQQ